jgi:hypothetical protein
MSDNAKVWVLLAIVAAGVLVGASWSHLARGGRAALAKRPTAEWIHRGLMALCAGFGLWAFTLFGQMHDHGANGHQDFHAHDCYHYYFGSKYLKEWGYDGMYFATVAALEEIGREEPRKSITFSRIRDLDGSARFLYRDDFQPHLAEAKARFSPARWALFKSELSFLRDITMSNDWWHGVMLDNGFNPPPSYAAITGVFANHIPFNSHTWKWLGTFDLVLMAGGVVAVGWAFGVVPALFTLVVMGNAPLTTFNWTGGSFFRQLWLFLLMIGVSCLARRKWSAAGAALGACAAAVFFPVFFLVGALTPLAYRLRSRDPRARQPLARTVTAAAVAIALLVGVSMIVYGIEPWWQWWHRILAHDLTFFDNHIGLKKITTFAPEVGRQSFGASDSVYPDWNRALVARAHRGAILELILSLVLSGWLVVGGLRARPAEACLVVGSGLLVIWTMPAGYYTIYAGTFAAVILANRSTWGERRFSLVAVALVAAVAMRRFERDLITQSFLISAGWIFCIFALSAMTWLERSAIPLTRPQKQRVATTALAVAGALLLALVGIRNWGRSAEFLPPEIAKGGAVADVLDFGPSAPEAAHHLDFHEGKAVQRKVMDIFGYLVNDGGRILKKDVKLEYDLAAAPKGGTLVVRTDAFYKGDLLTTVNDRVLPPVHIEPHKTLFTYLQVPLPADLGDGPLHVRQETTASDIALFTAWLLDAR